MSDLLKKLAQYDSPTICNAIELFHVRPRNVGYMDHRIQAAFPELPPMVGYAATACLRADAPGDGPGIYATMDRQIEQFESLPGPAVMVFHDIDDPPMAATFGEMMCSIYKAYGSTGVVTSGGGRDLLQIKALNFPVFTGSTIVSHGYSHLLNVAEPVRIGGLVVRQGDLLHGDANGVTNIPLDIASEVPDVAAEFLRAERLILDYVNGSGAKTRAGLVNVCKEYAAVIQRVTERVRRDR